LAASIGNVTVAGAPTSDGQHRRVRRPISLANLGTFAVNQDTFLRIEAQASGWKTSKWRITNLDTRQPRYA